ncbi:PREDICTED: uncharacterized protein LOC109147106 [Ipomoea nil]|uniref:uncharacterized protein LOC109147106 n=1 Tax=Ipomoea nil TaxID=35883 RepID=UPI000901FDDE|nr:PREDICTED: uncharacterized protein LOC109147106 [Ipomoea nil]
MRWNLGEENNGIFNIRIPDNFVLRNEVDPIAEIVQSTFPSYGQGQLDHKHLESQGILAPTLDIVDKVNEYMNSMNEATSKTYLSCDSVCKSDTNADMLSEVHTTEFLNSLRCSGVPNHSLTLKVGLPIMLLRNIDHTLGLCNVNTIVSRYKVTVLMSVIIAANLKVVKKGKHPMKVQGDVQKVQKCYSPYGNTLEQQQLDAQIPHEEAIVNEDEVETQDDDQVKSQQEVALRRSTR